MALELEERTSATMPAGTRRAVAINYHFVRASSAGRLQLPAHETPARFAEQLAALAGDFTFLACRDLYDESRDASEPGVLITFDDGAKDVSEVALPLLRNRDATATVLVCSKPYLEGKLLDMWTDQLRPTDLFIDDDDIVFICDLADRVRICTIDGELLTEWAAEGKDRNSALFIAPHAIAVDSQGSIYIGEVAYTGFNIDKGPRAIQKFARKG